METEWLSSRSMNGYLEMVEGTLCLFWSMKNKCRAGKCNKNKMIYVDGANMEDIKTDGRNKRPEV